MAHNSTLLKQRNTDIKTRFRQHRKRNPKWSIIAVIEQVAEDFYLSPATIAKILKDADNISVPCVDTVAKYSRTGMHAN